MAVLCTNCGAENAVGNAFCDQCGTGLAPACPVCGADNRPEARFCRSCGSALGGGGRGADGQPAAGVARPSAGVTAAPIAAGMGTIAERRLVSILFADLVAFTTFAEGRDPWGMGG